MIPPELLDAARSDMSSDAPRLAIADWLDEHGDPEWAELIRLQCRRASTPQWALALGERDLSEAREAELLRRVLPRLVPARLLEGSPPPASGEFTRGFLANVHFRGTLTADVLRDMTGAPLLEVFAHATGQWDDAPTELAPDNLPLLEDLPALREARVTLASEDLEWTHLEPLAARPLLARLVVRFEGRNLLASGSLGRRYQAERDRRARLLSPTDAFAAARAAFGAGRFCRTPRGVAVDSPRGVPGKFPLLDAVPQLRALELADDSPPKNLARWANLLTLSLRLPHQPAFRPPDWARLTELREVLLQWESSGPDWAAAVACLTQLPKLSSLSLKGPGGPEPRDLLPLRGLRRLSLHRLGRDADRLGWPELVEIAVPGGSKSAGLDAARFPRLRLADLGDRRPGAPGDADRAAALLGDGVRHTFGELSLTVPAWFAPEPPPPPDVRTPEVVPLAAWREWGDAEDELTLFAPSRVRLERIDADVPDTDVPARLAEPRPALPAWNDAAFLPRHVSHTDGRASLSVPTQWGWVTGVSLRHLWRVPGGAYRLVWEGARSRVIPTAELCEAVAKSGAAGP